MSSRSRSVPSVGRATARPLKSLPPTTRRIRGLVVAALLVSACVDDRGAYRSPTSPPLSRLPPPSAYPNFTGDAAYLEVAVPSSCGFSREPGDSETGLRWWVTVGETDFSVSEDPLDGPTYRGKLEGRSFADDFESLGDDPANTDCVFRGSSIVGTFSAEFDSFEADETLHYGLPGSGFRIVRRLHAQRR